MSEHIGEWIEVTAERIIAHKNDGVYVFGPYGWKKIADEPVIDSADMAEAFEEVFP